MKIGIVDIQTIVKELPDTKAAEKKLEGISKKYQDSLMTMQKELESKYKAYETQKGMMPEDQRAQEEQTLMMLDQQIKMFYEQKFGMQGEVNRLQLELLEPIREKVKNAIDEVAKQEKISLVLDKSQPAVLYSEDKFDITFRVLDKIKRSK